MPKFDFEINTKRLPKETPIHRWLQIFTYSILCLFAIYMTYPAHNMINIVERKETQIKKLQLQLNGVNEELKKLSNVIQTKYQQITKQTYTIQKLENIINDKETQIKKLQLQLNGVNEGIKKLSNVIQTKDQQIKSMLNKESYDEHRNKSVDCVHTVLQPNNIMEEFMVLVGKIIFTFPMRSFLYIRSLFVSFESRMLFDVIVIIILYRLIIIRLQEIDKNENKKTKKMV